MSETIRTQDIKPYSLELYGPEGASQLLLKVDSQQAFTPMGRGDRIQAMDAPGANEHESHEITAVEHLMWTAGDQVRWVTRVYTRPVPALR